MSDNRDYNSRYDNTPLSVDRKEALEQMRKEEKAKPPRSKPEPIAKEPKPKLFPDTFEEFKAACKKLESEENHEK